MSAILVLVVFVVLLALAFDYTNGFHDAANSIATIVEGIVQPEVADVWVVLATLVGAIGWNITTWFLGLPTSSSHALVGGLVGAALVKAGTAAIVPEGLWKTTRF